jgi:Flp pilus assembly pilin Flp
MRRESVMRKFARRFLADERAITPVLSSLLLTVIAVGAMAAATSATYVITTNLKETMSERVAVEDVFFNPATHTIDVYLTNTGKANIHVAGVYVNHASQTYTSPFNLAIKESGWLSISISWASGTTYYIDIVTNRGTHVADDYRAP